ncbi:membrane protein [Sulfolobales archaeon HS-7]|nr:membrane protein [Sulfolobales archaeon HS-7]
MDVGVFITSFAFSLLELTEAGAIAAIYHNIHKSKLPFIYAIAGVALVLIPTFTIGRLIYLVPINYVLLASSVILFYFGYRLLRSARRSFKHLIRAREEKEEGLSVVFAVSAVEGLEAALVLLALLPQSYYSTLLGTVLAAIVTTVLTGTLKSQVGRIRVPQLKFVLSALLFSLGTLWIGEVALGLDEIFLIPFLFAYLGFNYVMVKL